jgi:protein-S-isoprenylcysteine O-methyltransferase Ste14
VSGIFYVVIQFVLLGVIFFTPAIGPAWPESLARLVGPAGMAISWLGLLIMILAAVSLRRVLTALPEPRPDGELVQTGLYGWMRHPIYTGLLLLALGTAFAKANLISLICTGFLWLWLERKMAYEERLLAQKYAGYADYSRRVKKLIPGIY